MRASLRRRVLASQPASMGVLVSLWVSLSGWPGLAWKSLIEISPSKMPRLPGLDSGASIGTSVLRSVVVSSSSTAGGFSSM